MDLLGLLAAGLAQTPMGGLLGTQALPYSPGASTSAPGAAVMAEPFAASGAAYPNGGQVPIGQPAADPLAQGIIETASALGMDPADLATIISYETGGTFDPTQAGPTTQWGQHRGLIQFGEPQAQQYGVDWSDPLGSQLGADGAIVRYFRENGWQPGMGMLDAYSIVNAGGPGRYNASDAGNGGAPGTVADKVREQMGGHRENALALLGGERSAPAPTSMAFLDNGGGSMSNASTGAAPTGGLLSMPPAPERRPSIWDRAEGVPGLGLLADPDRRARIGLALAGMSMRPNEALIESFRSDLEDGRQQEQRQRLAAWLGAQDNPTAQNLAAMMVAGVPDGMAGTLLGAMQPPDRPTPIEINGQLVDPVTLEVVGDYRDAATQVQPTYMTGADVAGLFPGVQVQDPGALYVMGEDGVPQPVQGTGAPQAQSPTDDMREYQFAVDQGFTGTFADWQMERARAGGTTVNVGGEGQNIGTIPQGFAVVPDPGNPSGFRMEAIPGGPEDPSARVAATQNAQETSGDVILGAATRARDAYQGAYGGLIGAGVSYLPGSSDAEVYRQVDVLKANATIEALNAMRQQSPTGGALGNVTEGEGQMLAARAGALDPKSPTFERDLADYTRALLRTIHGVEEGDRIFAEQYGGAGGPAAAPADGAEPVADAGGPARFAQMTPEQLATVDIMALTDDELLAYLEATDPNKAQ